ncbi:hypothetical protein [uncultured Tenacibaculum sp.]|uniref:hypothetical protein n=1 Tax=uncultured Tenacibaculum sp. TaxID=174713 RepID=UPI002635B0A5|nr:hypothetical protein [uncultured Tenacibaculum sp.]
MQGTEFLKTYGINIGLLITGALSGLIGANIQEKKGLINYIFGAFCGACSSTYLTPVVVASLKLSPNYSYGTGFIIGLVSMNILTKLIEFSKNLDMETLKRLLPKR